MKRFISIMTALLLVAQLPLSALAVEADLYYGDVTITDTQVTHSTATETNKTEDHGGSVTVTQSNSETATSNTVTVTTETKDVTVTLENVNIDVSDTGSEPLNKGDAAVSVDRAEGTTVTIELEGTNNLSSGNLSAGLEVSGEGDLVIQDTDEDGTLNAEGGFGGAGIGAGTIVDMTSHTTSSDGKNITITGGTINAVGGSNAAGIGGAVQGDGSDITISGGVVNAEGGDFGAGIGGGQDGDGINITIKDGTVIAEGGNHGAGIGGGIDSNGSSITINGGTVDAAGGTNAAGIGGGFGGSQGGIGRDITISGGTVEAAGGTGGAGIGGGTNGTAEDIVLKEDANVTATGSGNAADIGDGKVIDSEEKQENKVDISELNPSGSFTGSDGEKIEGEYVPTVQPEPETPTPSYEEEEEETAPAYYPAAAEEEEPIFDIFKNGETEMEGTEEIKGSVLYVEAKIGHAAFTVKLSDLKALADKGIDTVVFITEKGTAAYSLAAILEALEGVENLTVTIDGETVTLHYGDEEKTELLLEKAEVEKLVKVR